MEPFARTIDAAKKYVVSRAADSSYALAAEAQPVGGAIQGIGFDEV
jgi:hypothetical protein